MADKEHKCVLHTYQYHSTEKSIDCSISNLFVSIPLISGWDWWNTDWPAKSPTPQSYGAGEISSEKLKCTEYWSVCNTEVFGILKCTE